MRSTALLSCLLLIACDGPGGGPARPDAGEGVDSGRRVVDAGGMVTMVDGGAVTADLCGVVAVTEPLVVPAGSEISVCPGSTITASAGATITVEGTLRLPGTAAERIQFNGDPRWGGLIVSGTLEADFTDLYDAELAIQGLGGSSIRFDDGLVFARATRNLRLANGGTFDRTQILEGGSVEVTGGTFAMTDSILDLDHPAVAPDCTRISGGTVLLDHVHITGCHCPVHISASDSVSVTASILDGAVYPVMIAESSGDFHGNVLSGSAAHFLDIGGGIAVDISGNFYVDDVPVISTDDPTQFVGVADVLSAAPADAGPR